MELNASMVRVEEAEASRATGPWEPILLLWGVGNGVKQTWAQIPAPPLPQLRGLGQQHSLSFSLSSKQGT